MLILNKPETFSPNSFNSCGNSSNSMVKLLFDISSLFPQLDNKTLANKIKNNCISFFYVFPPLKNLIFCILFKFLLYNNICIAFVTILFLHIFEKYDNNL